MNAQEDDGFREIQLNGKQLVFLVMAATTVLAVSFMLGMLVGRGVRAEREEAVNAEALEATPPTPERRTPSEVSAGNPYVATPPEPAEDEPPVAVKRTNPPSAAPELANAETGGAKSAAAPPAKAPDKPAEKPAATPVKPAADRPSTTQAPPQAAKAVPAPPLPAPAPAAAAAASAPAKPAPPVGSGPGSGYAVQVAAVNDRGEADAIVKRLSGKGYAAYVETPKGGTSVYRVRVGTFETRSAAQSVADKLTREERFKPWVTR